MASRNDELYGLYLEAHVHACAKTGYAVRLLEPTISNNGKGTTLNVRDNAAKVAIALGQRHGSDGVGLLSMERLVVMIGDMAGIDPERTFDLSAAKAAMKDVADAGKAAEPTKGTDQDPGKNITLDGLKQAIKSTRVRTVQQMLHGVLLADLMAATQGLGVAGEKVVERVATDGGVTEQTMFYPLLDPPNMGDVWEPRLGGPPIALLFFDSTCGSEGAWRTGYGDQDWITTDALRELYRRKSVASCGNSWISTVAWWAAVRAKVASPRSRGQPRGRRAGRERQDA